MTDATMTTATEPDGAPRVASLDILRGIAIMGILFMNINDMGGALFMGWMDIWRYGHSGADEVAFFLRNTLADGTARCMLEMLFGAGMMILTDRAASAVQDSVDAGRGRRVLGRLFGPGAVLRGYYWRNFVLFLFGLVHVFILLWPGDILHTYGIAAMVAFLFRRLPPKAMLALGLVMCLLQLGFGGAGYVSASRARAEVTAIEARQKAGQPITKDEAKTLAAAAKRKAERAKSDAETKGIMQREDKARADATGGFLSWAKAQWGIFLYLEGLFLEPLWIWEAAGTMLVGAALYRWGVLQGYRSRRFYGWLVALCYAFGLAARAAAALNEIHGYDGPSVTWATSEAARLTTTLGHIGLVHLLLGSALGTRLLRPFEAAGRTALTIYIAQTVICLWVLYPPFAFGLYGKQGWMAMMLTAAAVNALLLWAANRYVRDYRMAPVEWAWRSVIAGKRLPIRKRPSREPAGAIPIPA